MRRQRAWRGHRWGLDTELFRSLICVRLLGTYLSTVSGWREVNGTQKRKDRGPALSGIQGKP